MSGVCEGTRASRKGKRLSCASRRSDNPGADLGSTSPD